MNLKTIILFYTMVFRCCSGGSDKHVKSLRYEENNLRTLVFTSNFNNSQRSVIVDSILKVASLDSTVFTKTVRYFEKTFSDPNSSFRDETIYKTLLELTVESKWFSDSEKISAKAKINLVRQNKVGKTANDFYFITANGAKQHLYQIKSNFTLVFFYNPECDACNSMEQILTKSWIIHDKVIRKELTILSIYTDNDIAVWRKHLVEQPAQWVQGRDENESLYRNRIYDLRAIPSIYLLDRNKNVILKDCTSIEDIEAALLSNNLVILLGYDHN